MATIRKHTRIAKPADEVWKVVSDAGGVSDWFPVIQSSEASGNTRSCELGDGTKLTEEIVTNDDELRRFQYRITEGVPVDFHLGTVDVLEDDGGSLVVYSTEVQPDDLGSMMDQVVAQGIEGLKQYCEG